MSKNCKDYQYCQSCGMPMKKDENGGGSEKDGSKSTKYCSHCYINGEFTEPNITMEEMREKVKFHVKKELPFPFSLLAGFFSKMIINLERWKKK